MDTICRDLDQEHEALESILAPLSESDWNRPTPFDGWTIKEQVYHLHYFDRAARLSATDAGGFQTHLTELMAMGTDFDKIHQTINARGNALTGAALLKQWRREGKELIGAYGRLSPKDRLPWYSAPMGVRSSATARLMETWAHGLDILDTLGISPGPSPRLKHIAHLGVSTFAWSFKVRGLTPPESQVFVDLQGPDGKPWSWGPESTDTRVSGPAMDFCRVVTQRRHPRDTDLIITGQAARDWMENAQAFAGPPEEGPKPGQR